MTDPTFTSQAEATRSARAAAAYWGTGSPQAKRARAIARRWPDTITTPEGFVELTPPITVHGSLPGASTEVRGKRTHEAVIVAVAIERRLAFTAEGETVSFDNIWVCFIAGKVTTP